jgi:glycosyltransferase involved in cell wall biosynthesis
MIAFLSHEASRTGAPIMLLHFLRWYKANVKLPFLIIIKKGGTLSDDFKELGRTFIIFGNINNKFHLGLIKLFKPIILRLKLNYLVLVLKIHRVKLIYSNSITNGEITEFLSRKGFIIITHVHELEQTIRNYGEKNLNAAKKSTSCFIAASVAVKQNLCSSYGISPEIVNVIYECIEMEGEERYNSDRRSEILMELGISSANAFIIGGGGIIDFRKATEIFVLVANETLNNYPALPLYFIWLGADPSDNMYSWILTDIRKLGLSDKVIIRPSVSDPFKYYNLFDLFLLTSREDPFPLICLENASLGIPVLCFEGAGGMQEFVQNDAGSIIRYLDINLMSKKICELYLNEELRLNYGANARERVVRNHTVNTIASQILQVMNQVQEQYGN